MASRIWQSWLPQDVAQSALNEEPGRFAALSSCLRAEVEGALQDEADPNRWHRLMKWLCHVNTFNNTHQDYPAEHVVPLAEALWRSVAESWQDLEAQVRLADCLTKLLRTHKRTLRRARLVLPWKPMFSVLQRLHGLPQPKLEGVGLFMARGIALVKLVARARRYFEPWALGEVWCELRPAILAVGRQPCEGYEALGYLQLFAPTHNICRCNWSAVKGWLREWFAAWDGTANSPPWDSLWLALMSRVAKHDWRGVINWHPHLPHIFASFTGLFDVPIGTSRGATEVLTRSAPGRAAILFGDQMGFGSFFAARLIVHLLRSTADSERGPITAATAASAAAHLEHLTSLLEQYYHPSNTGKWCRELGTLLKHLVKAAVKQLERQQSQPPLVAAVAADAVGAAAAPTAPAGDVAEDLEFDYVEICREHEGAAGDHQVTEGAVASRPWVSELREPELQRLAACCVTLAARGQFSKDSSIANVSIKALSQLALVAPDRVLPLVLERFRTAIATATATHQLVAATATLALCVRPMLLTGWTAGGEGEERETAPQLLSEAVMAVLPGLDANDEPKTAAVMQLYVNVISSLPRLRGAGEEDESDDVAAQEEEEEHNITCGIQSHDACSGGGGGGGGNAGGIASSSMDEGISGGDGGGGGGELTLSLYVADWAEEVLDQCLALLRNLDSGPSHRGLDMAAHGGGGGASTSSFLNGPRSLFGPMWQLLLQHSRPSVRRRLVQRLAAFVLGGTAPGVAAEVALIASNAVSAAPRETLKSLLLPLLSRVEAEVEELPRLPDGGDTAGAAAAAPPPAPSTAREAMLHYQLTILIDALNQLHASFLLAPNLHEVIGRAAVVAAPPPQQHQAPSGGGGAVDTAGDCAAAEGPPPGSLLSRVLALGDKLMVVNSLLLQEDASALGAAVIMPLPRYWLEPHLPWRRPAGRTGSPVPLVPGRGVECWVDKFGTGYQPARWWTPSPAHRALANRLLQQHLVAPAQRLRELVAGGTAGGGGGSRWGGDATTKLRIRGELLKIRGMLQHSLCMLRDFGFQEVGLSGESGVSGDGGGGGGVPLSVFGSLGLTVGDPGIREQLAEALVEVCSALRSAGDPELLAIAARCGGVLLAAGSVEYVTAQEDERSQRATTHLHSDAPVASRLMPGTIWRRRSPLWLVQARLLNTLLSRASAAAFRSWATTQQPELTSLKQLPPAYLALLHSQCLLAQHPNTQLAKGAASAVEVATKRFPCLAPAFLPYFLATLADVSYNWSPSVAAPPSPPPLAEFFIRVRDAAFGGADGASTAAAPAAAPAAPSLSEIERNGKVQGACHTINSTLNFWRTISRSPEWLAAALAALLAARVYNESVPQKALGGLMLKFAGRFLHPPAMSYNGAEYTGLIRALLDVSKPGAMARLGAPFRYTVIANVMLTLLLPHRYGPSEDAESAAGTTVMADGGSGSGGSDYGGVGGAGPGVAGLLLRHMLGLLAGTDAPQLRQLGMSGTFLPLCAVEEYGAPLPQLVGVLREVISAAAEPLAAADPVAAAAASTVGGSWGSRLLHALIHNHTELDNAEAMKDKRGAGLLDLQRRVLNMTFEEMAGGVASLPLERLARWPNDGLAVPAAVAEGAFVVRHARLVHLLAAAAPAEMLLALKDPLEVLTAPDRLTTAGDGADKAEMAAAAEVLAGLLASGAPWVATAATDAGGGGGGGGGGGWVLAALARAVRGTSLDMSESWALSYRYAVHGLLDGLFPERLYTVAPLGPNRALPPKPPLAEGLTSNTLTSALGDLLAVSMPSSLGPLPPPVVAATEAIGVGAGNDAAGNGGGSGGGGLPARIKRLRCVGAVVRELVGLDPSQELPLPVRMFWRGLLDELHASAASLECLSLREQLRNPITDTLAYFGASEGLLSVLSRQQRRKHGGGREHAGVGAGGNGNDSGGDGLTTNGSNAEGDIIKINGEPSGVSTPAEMEIEVGGGGGGDADAVLLVLPPGNSPHQRYHDGLSELRSRARSLAVTLAARFNEAALQVQTARAAEAAVAPTPTPSPPGAAATPQTSGGGGGAGTGDSPSSRAATDELVMVDAADIVSVSASASETTSPGGSAAAGGSAGGAAAAAAAAAVVPMDVDISGGSSGSVATTAGAGAVAHLGLGLEVLFDAAARHRAPELRELVVGMLPGLLRLQDVAGPELQKFAKEFQATLLVVRCLSLNTHADATTGVSRGGGAVMLVAALDALSAAAVVEVPWSARAAALSYAQMFWFRHAPLLSPEQLRHLQSVVAASLQDSKAEVRSLAAATLSGLLHGTAPEDVNALRLHLLEKASQLFGAGAGRRRPHRQGSAAVDASTAAARSPQQLQLEKLGCVAGLSALLMSDPYDVRAWLPPVLMAVVRAAGGGERDGAVRGEAGRALREFRRTHEAEALEELRGLMDADDWDCFTQATGTASYFV